MLKFTLILSVSLLAGRLVAAEPIDSPPDEPVQAWVFTMPGCGPCGELKSRIAREMVPVGWRTAAFESAASRSAHVVYLDQARQAKEVVRLGIERFPTIVILRDGREVWRHEGLIDSAALVARLRDQQRQWLEDRKP